MSYLDWGMHDLTEAVEYLDDGSTPIFWVGHSFGCQRQPKTDPFTSFFAN